MTSTVITCDRCRATLDAESRVALQLTGNVPAKAACRFDLCPPCRGELAGWLAAAPASAPSPTPAAAPAATETAQIED